MRNWTGPSITLEVNKRCTASKHNHSLGNVFFYFSVQCLLATDVLDDNATRKSGKPAFWSLFQTTPKVPARCEQLMISFNVRRQNRKKEKHSWHDSTIMCLPPMKLPSYYLLLFFLVEKTLWQGKFFPLTEVVLFIVLWFLHFINRHKIIISKTCESRPNCRISIRMWNCGKFMQI